MTLLYSAAVQLQARLVRWRSLSFRFSGVTVDQVLWHYQCVDGCRSAPVAATGCCRCRHGCRQLPPGHPLASRSTPRRGPSPYHLEACRSLKVVDAGQRATLDRWSSTRAGVVAALRAGRADPLATAHPEGLPSVRIRGPADSLRESGPGLILLPGKPHWLRRRVWWPVERRWE